MLAAAADASDDDERLKRQLAASALARELKGALDGAIERGRVRVRFNRWIAVSARLAVAPPGRYARGAFKMSTA